MLRSTRTYATLPVHRAFYEMVKGKLKAAGYDHAIHRDGQEEVLDMHGIALEAAPDVDTGELIEDAHLAAWADLAAAIHETTGPTWTVALGVEPTATREEARAALAKLYADEHEGPFHIVGAVDDEAKVMRVAAITSATSKGAALASYFGWSQPQNVLLLLREAMRERSAKRGFSCGPREIGQSLIESADMLDIEAAVQTAAASVINEHPGIDLAEGREIALAQQIAWATVELLRKKVGESGIPEDTAPPVGVEHEGGDVDSDGDEPLIH